MCPSSGTESIDVQGVATTYRRSGVGDPLVYLRGAATPGVWLPFLHQLAADHDVIAPEHPGFGDTPLPDGLDSFEDVVLHYDGFFEALQLDRVHLVGHAFGGWIAAEIAVFYPRRLASLTLITPVGLRLVDADLVDIFRMAPEEERTTMFNGREERYADLLAREGGDALIKDLTERATLARLAWNPRYDRKLDTRLARVTAPTLVIGAQADRMAPTEMAQRFAELMPSARLVTAMGPPGEPSGHLPHVEDPDQIAQLIAELTGAGSR